MSGFGTIIAVGEPDARGRRPVTIRFRDGQELLTDNGHFFRNGSHPEVGVACFVTDPWAPFGVGVTTAHSTHFPKDQG